MPWLLVGVLAAGVIWWLTRAPTQSLQVTAGLINLTSAGAMNYIAYLPQGAQWAPSVMGGSGPAINPYGGVTVASVTPSNVTLHYSGQGGGAVSLGWVDAAGNQQSTTVTVSPTNVG